MEKSTFRIAQLDCAAEESLVRMKLDGMPAVKALDFDLQQRRLLVFHQEGHLREIEGSLAELRLGSSLLHTESTTQEPERVNSKRQRKLIWIVLLINFSFFVIELATGVISASMGLVADSLDMLADALVYALTLLAVGSTVARKKHIARTSGYFQLLLAVVGFMEVARRVAGMEPLPDFRTMIVVSILALAANAVSLYLLQQGKSTEAHMQASMICTSNDIIINAGVVVAGLLVLHTGSALPDLLVGAIVFMLVIRAAMRILVLAR